MFVRSRFQYGSLRLRKRERSTDVWEFRYYETSPVGKRIRQSVILGDQALYRTEADARKATQALLIGISSMSCQSDTRHRGRISRTFGNTSGRVGAINR
jgi:integrase